MPSLIRQIKKTYGMARPHERRTVLQNFASLSVLQAITYILPVLILPYLFRVIGPEKFGLIAFAQAFIQYFMILTDYGFSISATKEISLCQHDRAEINRVFSSVMIVKVILALVSLAILGCAVYFIPKFRSDWPVYVFSFGAVLGNTLFPVWFFQGTEKMKHIADINIAGGVLTVLLLFFCVKGPRDYLMVPIITSIVGVITGLWGQYIAFRKMGVSFEFPGYTSIQKRVAAGWDIFVSIVAINAYTNTRIFAVGLLTNNAITGFYAIADKVAGLCQTFPLMSFSQALFPRLSRIFQKSKKRAYEFMERIQLITINISLICLPLIFVFAERIIKFVFGGSYPKTVLSLRLLLVAVLFAGANAFRVQFLLVCGKTHIYSRIHVVMAMIGLPLTFLLIDSFSYVGAAVATIVIEAGILAITYVTVKRLKPS
ncbi:MAG TPA: flippase [Candidatus Omnitrophota bacterium]|nr:flippase [Candidatus Omnitrophota bacterium]HRY85498.1 flippase [Candidatus Omnitrophota bacterium]